MRALVNPPRSRPVWAFIELGHPFTEPDWPTIQPAEVQAAVWQSLIAGARGLIYFNHTFGGPNQSQHILRDPAYAAIRSAVTMTVSIPCSTARTASVAMASSASCPSIPITGIRRVSRTSTMSPSC